jgi:hypothetical protein
MAPGGGGRFMAPGGGGRFAKLKGELASRPAWSRNKTG